MEDQKSEPKAHPDPCAGQPCEPESLPPVAEEESVAQGAGGEAEHVPSAGSGEAEPGFRDLVEEAVPSWEDEPVTALELGSGLLGAASSGEPQVEPAEKAAQTGEEVASLNPGALEQEGAYPRFDPVAAFLSTQSAYDEPRPLDQMPRVTGKPEHISLHEAPVETTAHDADGVGEGEQYAGTGFEEEPQDDHEEFHPVHPAATAYRQHWFMRLFAFCCWMLILAFAGAAGAGYVYYRYATTRLFEKQAGPARTFDVTVQSGDSYRKVIARMKSAGLLGSYMGIDDAYLMRYLGWTEGTASRIRHGAYRFESTLSLAEIYGRLQKGAQENKLTLPEGLTVHQVGELAARHFEGFDAERFVGLTHDAAFITSLGMYVPSLEGYLLPGTYFFGGSVKEEEFIRLLVTEFQKAAEKNLRGIPKTDDLSFHEHVILASLIEREARIDEDRPLIASVILNRVRKKMKLEIDATVNYALNDWRRLTHDDLKVDSPYNTYKIAGLPPAPICNPRMESLVATYTAPATDFLFYVHRGDGRHAFASSYEEHLKNVKEFIKKRGGSTKGAEQARAR